MKEIRPYKHINARIEVPGSKSITQRALIAAALAKGDSILRGPLASDDTRYTAKALRAMGVRIKKNKRSWKVSGNNGQILEPPKKLYLGNNGTATRFLASLVSLGHGVFSITGDKRMEQRPIQPLIDALCGWGVAIRSIKETGCPPLEVRADGIRGGLTTLPEGRSSQYLSSLLLVAPYAAHRAKLEVAGEVYSKPYVQMTLNVMKSFGVKVIAKKDFSYFEIPRRKYLGQDYQIEGDASSASYFWAAAAVTEGRVEVVNVPKKSMQGDTALVKILAEMGCLVEYSDTGILVEGPAELKGVDVDMADCPDVVPTLAVVAARAKGRTIIRNIGHLRIKECDRLHVMSTELNKLGVRTEEGPDYLVIEGAGARATLNGAVIDTHDDHRIAMSFAVAGLFVPGVRILDEGVVAKSFPDFWERFQKLYGIERDSTL
ncbi:MAG: 3-phosphoshikimate 1-carboxyvinyltransferase [Proteobacteria bacterium]|nr:3-phosphoshikimate 1-carboxyvinyltransferase [Pseudomonadota bacterium]MBU1736978.1 3-phosphoshikimate 1-carboxyvinyltransferase [Pseudomonadota bacterium]